MSEIVLSECSLGDPDAQHDSSMLDIGRVFVKAEYYHRLLTNSASFIVGRRGAGKSALALHARNEFSASRMIVADESEYERYKEAIRAYAGIYQLSSSQITDVADNLWRFVLAVVSLQAGLSGLGSENPEIAKSATENLARWGLTDANVGGIIRFAQAYSTDGVDADINGPMEVLRRLNELWNDERVRRTLSMIGDSEGGQFAIFFDSLEKYEFDEPEMVDALTGIAKAMLNFANTPNLDRVIRIFFSMPGEIFEDVAKIAPGKIFPKTVFVQWRYGELIWLVALRYLQMLERARIPHDSVKLKSIINRLTKSTAFNDNGRALRKEFFYDTNILPATVDNRMGTAEDTFAYIFRHTQLRPRELITVFNQMLSYSRDKQELPNISGEVIRSSLHRPEILQNLVKDALSPFDDVFDDFADATSAVLSSESRVFLGSDLARWSKRIYDTPRSTHIDDVQFRTYLIRSGIIGEVCAEAPHSVYTAARFEYLVQDRIPFSNDRLFCVHPIVGDFLKMKRHPGYGPIYPVAEEDEMLEG